MALPVSKLLYNDEFLVHNIGKFNRNRLQTWVLSNEYMNDFIEEMDEGTLPKEKYAQLVESMPHYFVNLGDSGKKLFLLLFRANFTFISVGNDKVHIHTKV